MVAHAGTLVAAVERAARDLDLPGRSVLVAVSGGIDSVSLFRALRDIAQRNPLKLLIGHVNHSLRGAESEADEAAVRGLAAEAAVPIHTARVDPHRLRAGRSSRARPTLEEAARRLRYDALRCMADAAHAERIATAHTANDQAETVLLRLLRGTGPDGLGGIPERSPDGRVVRPLLRVTREEVVSFARERGLSWREDRSNADLQHARNRLRKRWLPGLQDDFNPRLLRAIADLAEAQRRDSEWIDGLVESAASSRFSEAGRELRIERKDWDSLPEALARRVVRLALRRCGAGRDVSRTHLERALRFLKTARTGTQLELPGGLRLVCEPSEFRLTGSRVWLGGAC